MTPVREGGPQMSIRRNRHQLSQTHFCLGWAWSRPTWPIGRRTIAWNRRPRAATSVVPLTAKQSRTVPPGET